MLYVISAILGLSAVMLTTTSALKAMLFLLALCAAGGVSAKLYLDRLNGRAQDDPPSQGRTGATPRKLHQPPSDVAGNDYFFGEEERSDK